MHWLSSGLQIHPLKHPPPSSDTSYIVQFEKGVTWSKPLLKETKSVPFLTKLASDGELLSHYSRGRILAGSFQGKTGHADGKPSEARFNHPTMDDKGNLGFRDGPSEDAKFSNDFDLVYVRPTCSLLVIDRGNAALRQISLPEEDCEYHSCSVPSTGKKIIF
ncbi:hypothetical protein Bca52824_007116 [Brassica carinata]|uniref:Uncharacterized protein n=1 Tax=Brassica carinata TaxID=52824 RepID=A0A8X7W9B1_BRACI|nr:hypothetical protein Bca52824_007116 [Brassica carinata]